MSLPHHPADPLHPHRNDPLRPDVVDPITLARARLHAGSVFERTRQVLVDKSQNLGGAVPKRRSAPPSGGGLGLDGFSGCFFLVLLALVFLMGSVVGGVVGGGMMLWASGGQTAAVLGATPTPQPTPTPAPAATPTPTPTPTPQSTPAIEDVIARILPSVVTVINQQFVPGFSQEEGRVVGSGVIVDERGYIATNNHVIDNPGELHVIFADGREALAELVAADPGQDLALLKVSLGDLPAILWGDSSTVRLGQEVYAIGSPLGDFPNSVSFGIVSGLNRALEMNEHVIEGLIQTDAAINRGSSGGPLINRRGEMIGINTFIIRESEDRGIAEGIAFAIPVNTAKQLLLPWIAAHSGEPIPIPVSGETGN